MLGHTAFRLLSATDAHEVWGTMRQASHAAYFPPALQSRLLPGLDVLDQDALAAVIARIKPDVIINCVGLIKQLAAANDPLVVLPINAMLPHRLANLSALAGARLIHISTDCVFAGKRGHYAEDDISDAEDLYGKSKYLGEVHDQKHVLTLRTSIIGHELNSRLALLEWFLAQEGSVHGYKSAIFSGLPTIELARVIRDYVLPNQELSGLYQVASAPIAKFELLQLIARRYQKNIQIIADDTVHIDRSLNGQRFREATSYQTPDWEALVDGMFLDHAG